MKDESVKNKFGKVQIKESVIASIAGLSATDVKGVRSLAGGIEHDMITHEDGKSLARAIRVSIQDGKISLKIAIVLDGTRAVPEVARALQEKVKSYLEMMTGNEVTSIDVIVAG